MTSEVENVQKADFEAEIDVTIDRYFAEKGIIQDTIDLEEKKFIIKELALANKKSEIVPKLNGLREAKSLPLLSGDFDIFYYAKEYAQLIEDISMTYALNLAKKFRFANRITRIGKLNDVAEGVLDRINKRESEGVKAIVEPTHNANIKLFAQLISAIDEQMGKLKVTRLDVNVNRGEVKQLAENAADIKAMVGEALKKFSNQLPSSVDANFTEVTDYDKCEHGEEWSSSCHCKVYNERCKVETGEISKCPLFLNKILLGNREWMARRYTVDKLSRKQIAELAGCKEIDERAINAVTRRLKDVGIYRNSGTTA
jgi:hypothetical protein